MAQCRRMFPSVEECVPVREGFPQCGSVCHSVVGCTQCVRVCPSVGGCVLVWEGVPQCGRVFPSVGWCGRYG